MPPTSNTTPSSRRATTLPRRLAITSPPWPAPAPAGQSPAPPVSDAAEVPPSPSPRRLQQSRCHRVADRDCERVGLVRRRRRDLHPQDRLHHPLHLRFLGAPVAADGLLDVRRRVLHAPDPGARGRDENGAAGLPDRESG